MTEAAAIVTKVPAAPPSERGTDQIRESLETGIRQKASTPHLMVKNRITEDGKAVAAGIYQKNVQQGANTGQFVEAAKGIRQEINEELSGYRKDAKEAVLKALEKEGKTRRQIGKDEFKERVKSQLTSYSSVQEIYAMRKLLSSVVQRAKSAETAQIRLKLKSEVTEEEIDTRMQELRMIRSERIKEYEKLLAEKKIEEIPPVPRVPGRELVRNALAEQRRKALRESLQAQEMSQSPTVSVPEQQVVYTQTPVIPEAETKAVNPERTARAVLLTQRAKKRYESLRSSIMTDVVRVALRRGQYGTQVLKDTAAGIGKNVVRRPLASAAAALAITGMLALQNPAAVGATAESILAAVASSGKAGGAVTPVPAPTTQFRMEINQQTFEVRSQPQNPVVERAAPVERGVNGGFAVNTPMRYKLGTNERISEKIPTGEIKVLGYADQKDVYRFKIEINGEVFEVPIEQVMVKEELPIKEMPKRNYLGIRVNSPNNLDKVFALGATRVRVASNGMYILGTSREEKNFKATMDAAKEKGLQIRVVFNPNHLLSKEEYYKLLEPLVTNYPNLQIELQNEPDHKQFFEDDEQMNKLADSLILERQVIDEITKKHNVKRPIIIGPAMVHSPNINKLAYALEARGETFAALFDKMAVHVYHTVEHLQEGLDSYRITGDNMPIAITEMGGENMPLLISEARKDPRVREIDIHELDSDPFPTGEPSSDEQTLTLVKGNKGLDSGYYSVQKYAIDHS